MDYTLVGQEIIDYAVKINWMEAAGLVFGLLAVYFLIKENILTWPAGIIYVLISFVIFYQVKLYADFILHIFFLIMNIYGWYYWVNGRKKENAEVPVTTTSTATLIKLLLLSALGIGILGYSLSNYTDASLPYWDSTTTILSLTGMWLTAKKKIENWHFWFVVDVLATGIYFYKGIYFYAFLYLVYIAMAIIGYIEWKKSLEKQTVID